MYTDNDYRLYHHGILGQKWGIRRFQNKDGSLKPAGRARYREDRSGKKGRLSDKQKTALKVGATVFTAAIAAYGGYKVYKGIKTLDAESLAKSKEALARAIGVDSARLNTSIKISSKTGVIPSSRDIRSSDDIRSIIKSTIKADRRSNRTIRNVARAAANEIKNDVVDAKDTLSKSKYSPWRNPFMSSDPTERLKYKRNKVLETKLTNSDAYLNKAIKDYEDALKSLEKLKGK